MPPQIISGPPAFLTLSNVAPISWAPIGQRVAIYFDSDQSFISRVSWTSPDDQTIPPGFFTELGANSKGHAPVIDLGAPHPGKHIIFTITVDPSDTSGLTLRPYVGTYDFPGTRMPAPIAGISVPVRFYMFGDGTRPPNGGGTGPLLNGPAAGNWSSYTWAQYNPKGTVFPAP